jgi:hypothetical protein
MGEGAWRKLTPSSKLKYLEAEKNIREIHLEITKTMSITELKALKKHEYRDLMKKEMYDMVPQLTETVVKVWYLSFVLREGHLGDCSQRWRYSDKPCGQQSQ